jgi:hypothetical protein
VLTVAVLTVAVLTVAVLTVAVLTVAVLPVRWFAFAKYHFPIWCFQQFYLPFGAAIINWPFWCLQFDVAGRCARDLAIDGYSNPIPEWETHAVPKPNP